MKILIARMVISGLAAIIVAYATQMYDYAIFHNKVVHDNMELPVLLNYIHSMMGYMYAVPIITSVIGAILLKKHLEEFVVLAIDVNWLFCLTWPILTIGIWKMPFVLL
jgi:hypothetical protein